MYQKALWQIQYGLYVVASHQGEKLNGQIANTVFQVTAEPPTLAVCINKQNLTHDFIEASGVFSVSILSMDAPMQLIGRFGFKSGRDIDKFAETEHRIGETQSPIVLEHTVAFFECEVHDKLDCGSHTLFVGNIIDCEILDQKKEPMTYKAYHEIKGGKTPKNATTFISQESLKNDKKEETKMQRYICTVWGYVYYPEGGDPDNGIEPGTAFEDILDDWVCPVCGVGKEEFDPHD